MKLPEYRETRKSTTYNAEFKTPRVFEQMEMEKEAPFPPDIRGFRPFPNERFHPDDAMCGASFALVVEDVLARIKNESEL